MDVPDHLKNVVVELYKRSLVLRVVGLKKDHGPEGPLVRKENCPRVRVR